MKLLLLVVLAVAAVIAEEDALLKEFSDGNVRFSANIYKEMLKTNSGNFLVCPLSVDVVLALVHAGAKGNTAKQLSAGLQLPESHEKVQDIFKKLAPTLEGNDKYELNSANKVYVKDGFKIKDTFKSTAVDVFNAEIQNVDFSKKEEASSVINKWVEDKTHEKIKDLISPSDLSADTRAVLVNALYFKGAWVKQFSEYGTKKRPFHLNNKDQVDVDMMDIVDTFNYYEDKELNAKFLEMPYQGGDISMIVALPNDKEGLSALESKIERVLTTPKFTSQRVHVQLPKYKIESSIQFKPILQKLGVLDAFEDVADFSGIAEDKLKIDKVIQKTFIEVEEKGTTAAAATAVVMLGSYMSMQYVQPPIEFNANSPFIFLMKYPGGIMFLGRYVTK